MDKEALRALAEAASTGQWEHCILDRELAEIPAYIETCIKASGGPNFHFVVGSHPDGKPADICHVGNGTNSGINAAYIASANPAAIIALLDELQTLREERAAWRVTAENAEKDAERYRWLLANYARGDGYDAIDQALNDGEPDTQLSPAIDAAIESLKEKTP